MNTVSSPTVPVHRTAPPRAVAALLSLAVTAFCFVAMETLPVGLLPLISASLHVSLSATGLLVTWYAVTVAVVSLPLAYLAQGMSRRRLVSGLLAVLVVATLVAAAAPGYALLLAARIVIALTQALFWAVVAPAAAGMFPIAVRGRVMSIVFSGAALAPMVGVPAGTWLGQQAGWRAAFYALAGLALVALVAIVALMPDGTAQNSHAATGTNPSRVRYWVVVLVTTLSVTGLFTAFTYTSTFLTDVGRLPVAAVSLALLSRGIADFCGISVGGVLTDRHQRTAIVLPMTLLTIALLGMYLFGTRSLTVVALLTLSGFAMGSLTPGLSNRVLEVAPGSTELASAGNSAAFNVGIAAGSFLGGVVLTASGIRATALVGGIAAAVGLGIAVAEPLLARWLGHLVISRPRRDPV
ncbi:MAG: transporter, family, inner rane transport protein [Micromonosporaceae bacterium]